jgi:hypothetical protein
MGRRNRELKRAEALISALGFLWFLGFYKDGFHVGFWSIFLPVLGVIGIVIWIASLSSKPSPFDSDSIQLPRIASLAPAATGDLTQQLRELDWFQFEKIVAVA